MKHYSLDEPSWKSDLKGLINIRSVGKDCGPLTDQAPLGQGIYDALQYALELGKRMGFRVKMLDGYSAWIETGYGERMVAALGHVDTVSVVPENWRTDPFDLVEKDGWLYGRGVCDNKGPIVLLLHAMKAIADSGETLGKRIRLILGGDDESGGWSCMKRYRETEELPECAFVADGSYPVVNAEKGLMHITLFHPYDDKCFPIEIHAGVTYNSVPPYAYAVVDGVKYEAQGKAAHASAPEDGLNALLELCSVMEDEGISHPLVDMMMTLYYRPPWVEDTVSGALTINPAIVHSTDSGIELKCDLRLPVTVTIEQAMEIVKQNAAQYGFDVNLDFFLPPFRIPEDSYVISTLRQVYRDCTGRNEPLAASGVGTYARTFENAATFGPLFPGEENTTHTPRERWELESMRTAFQIYCNALREL